MSQDPQNELQCSQFEALLADALDHAYADVDVLSVRGELDAGAAASVALTPEQRQAFEAHSVSCAICGPMFAEVQQGMALLRELPEIDPPKNLVHNILAHTSRSQVAAEVAGAPAQTGATTRWLESLRPAFSGLLHSRFATSFAMAFFSLSLTLTLAGVKITDIAKVDWRPSALRRSVVSQYTNVEARVMRYYDNMRLVYEVERLKKVTSPQKNNDKQEQNRNHHLPTDDFRPENQERVVQELDVPPQQARMAEEPAGGRTAEFTIVDEGAQL
jgi:hypothetical protein